MLTYLRVRGLALLEDAELELSPGLNVLTGETGAGKSMVVDGLCLVRGIKAMRASVRSGSSEAQADAEFALPAGRAAELARRLEAHGLPALESGTLLLQRTVPSNGRSRCFVQGRLTTLPVMGELGAELVEITSQHEHQSLTSPVRQLALLDAFGELGAFVDGYGELYRELCRARQEAIRLGAAEQARQLRLDLLRHQLDELERLAPRPGELGELSERVALLRESRRWSELAAEARHVLIEDDSATLPRVTAICRRLARAGSADPKLGRLADALESVCTAAEAAADAADALGMALEPGPGELDACEERLSELTRLSKKHGVLADRLPELCKSLASELAELEAAADALSAASERQRDLESRCHELADALHTRRVGLAESFASAVGAELRALCMAEAGIGVRIERLAELGPHGLSRVELELAANRGEPSAPLARVASGGELSRLLLALRCVVTARGGTATYVFDEVDAGVGGRVAEAIGVRLARTSRHHQVLCITHLPQIAAFADAHFSVTKHVEHGRTVTRVRPLDADERTAELARMLGGSEPSARAHAEALLASARRPSGPRRGAHTRPHRSRAQSVALARLQTTSR